MLAFESHKAVQIRLKLKLVNWQPEVARQNTGAVSERLSGPVMTCLSLVGPRPEASRFERGRLAQVVGILETP
jgi:hypothetical protein